MIRRAKIIDFEGIKRLMSHINPSWTDKMIYDAIISDNADVFVAGDGGIDGCIFVEYAPDEGCITAVATDKAKRRCGIAKALIAHVESAREKGNIYLEVEETNEAAIRLYEACGYKQTGKRKNYYGDAAAIIMNKEF